jgi:hypothetical protein
VNILAEAMNEAAGAPPPGLSGASVGTGCYFLLCDAASRADGMLSPIAGAAPFFGSFAGEFHLSKRATGVLTLWFLRTIYCSTF